MSQKHISCDVRRAYELEIRIKWDTTKKELTISLNSCKLNLLMSKLEQGEGNGTPLQYSCLENPTDGGAS